MADEDRVYMDLVPRYVGPGVGGMLAPVRCKWCHQVHDSAKVDVLRRYSDCSVWKCPNCGTRIDDRPESWGGSAIPIKE